MPSATFDPSELTKQELDAAISERRNREKTARDGLLLELPTMSIKELKKFIKEYERETGMDEWECENAASMGEYEHDNGDKSKCPACAARAMITRKKYIANSKKPGENPCIYIPGVQTASYMTRTAKDVVVGDVVEHYPVPGLKTVEYVEALCVKDLDSKKVEVTWRRTNDDQAPKMVAVYNKNTPIGISRAHIIGVP